MTTKTAPDVDVLRSEAQKKYAEVAAGPGRAFHFHTGRPLAEMLGYPAHIVDDLPDQVVESFAGVGNPLGLGTIDPGHKVVDIGSGSGFDCVVAGRYVGERGRVVGVDMTREMLAKAEENHLAVGLDNIEFRFGYAEELPVDDSWADVVTSNGVINLCPDKDLAFQEAFRVLKPGGQLMLADIVTYKPVPKSAKEDVNLWTA